MGKRHLVIGLLSVTDDLEGTYGKWIKIESDEDLPCKNQLVRTRTLRQEEKWAYYEEDKGMYGRNPTHWSEKKDLKSLHDVTHWYQICIPTRREQANGISPDKMWGEYELKKGEGKA